MFGLFHDPYGYYGYQPRRVIRINPYHPYFGYQRPMHVHYDPFGINSLGAYMNAMDHAFNQMFGPSYEEEEETAEAPAPKEQEKPETKPEEKQEAPKPAPQQVTKKEAPRPQPQYFGRSSVYSSHSRSGIEEIREKTYDSRTGETVESQTRRIGDRWCRIDTTIDKDGHSKSKETWHNVADEEMEDFKKEWVSRRGLASKAPKALSENKEKDATETKDTNETKEETKEEKETNEVKDTKEEKND